jgi:xanthine dehydrogenase YagT iron-sulfur-binding subunit
LLDQIQATLSERAALDCAWRVFWNIVCARPFHARRGARGEQDVPIPTFPNPKLAHQRAGDRSAARSSRMAVRFKVNGREIEAEVEPRVSLLDYLRETLHLTGTKKGCNEGACGTCTVLIDGKRMNGCLTLAVQCAGREVTTIEGVAADGGLHPVQAAFIRHDAFQCGYCTPGQILSAIACIREGHAGTADEIREWMSGNICRCSAYPQIVAAVRDAADQLRG